MGGGHPNCIIFLPPSPKGSLALQKWMNFRKFFEGGESISDLNKFVAKILALETTIFGWGNFQSIKFRRKKLQNFSEKGVEAVRKFSENSSISEEPGFPNADYWLEWRYPCWQGVQNLGEMIYSSWLQTGFFFYKLIITDHFSIQ